MNTIIKYVILLVVCLSCCLCSVIKIENVEVLGPGLTPDKIVMPGRYFFIYFRGQNYIGDESVNEEDFKVVIRGRAENRECRLWVNILNRKDSSVIVRYKLYETCNDLQINIFYKSLHVPGSPFFIKGPVLLDNCYCPNPDVESWMVDYGCKDTYKQIQFDLSRFHNVSFDMFYDKAVERFNNSYRSSVCHYAIKQNQVYRSCYGQHVGFKMFIDSILLALTRITFLPDLEFITNLGDWPLMELNTPNLFPLFSWCGSKETADIVLPSYQITEASLELMGRVSLDMLSVQGNTERTWVEKEEKCFWRGRDSSRERLSIVDLSRKYPDLINASLTNFFFYKKEEKLYGPKTKHISFFKFFDYKYQLNLDGTVAAFRFPFLLAGDSLVIKQNSGYYEHFYRELSPWVHYIPIKADLSDLIEKINWAKENDEKARAISRAGRIFVQNNLLPQDIICYHAKLLVEWSKKLTSKVEIKQNMELVKDNFRKDCTCHGTQRDEL